MTLAAGYASIAVCDRCCFKVDYKILRADPNYHGLRVCPDCLDFRNPWLEAPAKPDAIALKFPRPDTPIGLNAPADFIQWDASGRTWDSGLTWDETVGGAST